MTTPPDETGQTGREEVLSRFSYAEAFRTRKRPNVWLYILIEALIILAVAGFFILRGGFSASSWFTPLAIGILILGAYAAWHRASPLCPNCRKDIRTCGAVYCHICGDALKAKRCSRCGVLQSWLHILAPLGENTGNKQPIKYCPGCAAHLDTDFHRWLGGGES